MARFAQIETSLVTRQYESLKDGDDWSPAFAQMITDHAAIIAAGQGRVGFDFGAPGTVYEMSAALDIGNIPIIGYPEFRPDFTLEPIVADGSIGSFSNLDSDAVKGENRIVCAVLAAAVARGDILKITSSLDFSSNEAGIKQSQMVSVRNVISDTIYLNEILLDNFLASDTAQAAIVTLAQVDVLGKIKVVHSPAANDTNTRGVRFKWASVRGRFELIRCQGNGATFNNNWHDDVAVHALDAVRTGTGITAYGISIQNGTMYGHYRGVISGVRHAVSGSGSPTDGGSSWGNVAEVYAHGAFPAAMLDAHSNVGSIHFLNCHAVGGTIRDLDGTLVNDPPGLNSGARYTYVTNLTAIRTGTVVQIRSDGADDGANGREEFIVNGVHVIDGSGVVFNKSGPTPSMTRICVRGLSGNVTDKSVAAINFNGGDVTKWEFDNIKVHGCRLFNIAASITTVPPVLRISDFETYGPSDTEGTATTTGLTLNTGTSVTRVQLRNGLMRNMYRGIWLQDDLALLDLSDVEFENSLQHITLNDAVVAHMKVRGGSMRNARHADATQGCVAIGTSSVTLLEVDGVEVDTDTWFVGGAGAVGKAIVGTLKTHAGFLGFSRTPAAAFLEILSGSPDQPRLIRGAGSPNTVVTAPKGCIFQRRDGAAGTLLYVNTDGATAWTAYA
jgi:hypothetical protein